MENKIMIELELPIRNITLSGLIMLSRRVLRSVCVSTPDSVKTYPNWASAKKSTIFWDKKVGLEKPTPDLLVLPAFLTATSKKPARSLISFPIKVNNLPMSFFVTSTSCPPTLATKIGLGAFRGEADEIFLRLATDAERTFVRG